MIAGDELSNPKIVDITIRESTARVLELVEWGVNFDKTDSGKYALARKEDTPSSECFTIKILREQK